MVKSRYAKLVWVFLSLLLLGYGLRIIPAKAYVHDARYSDLYSTQPVAMAKHSLWNKHLEKFSARDLKESERLMIRLHSDSLDNGTFKRYLRTAVWLNQSLAENPRNKSRDTIAQLETIEQFLIARKSASEPLLCGNFANFSLLFMSKSGFQTRYIALHDKSDAHVFTESFIPEINQWVLSDFMYGVLLLRNGSGKLLNSADLLHCFAAGETEEIEMLIDDGDSMQSWMPFEEEKYRTYFNESPHLLYFKTLSLTEAYAFNSKLKRMLMPSSWYFRYGTRPVSNHLYYIRLTAIYLWILLTSLLIFNWIHDRGKKYKKSIWRQGGDQ